MSNAKHYIDVQEALDQQADKMLSEQGYSAGLFLKPAAKTPELKNLNKLRFPKLRLAFIIAEVMSYGTSEDQQTIQKQFEGNNIKHMVDYANEKRAERENHVNADRVHRLTDADDLGSIATLGTDDEGVVVDSPRMNRSSGS